MKFRLRETTSENYEIIYVLEYTKWLLDTRHPCSVKGNWIIDNNGYGYVDFDYAYEALEKCKSGEAKFIS